MSFQAMTWAVEQKTENAGQKLVLLMLSNYCNAHTGQCNPSHKRLAAECCMGVSTLKNHLSRLEELGFLKVVHHSSEGVSLPNSYLLNFEGVGKNLTVGGSESGWGVGQNLATNQEGKPVIEPINKKVGRAKGKTQFPKDFQPNETNAKKALDLGLNLTAEVERFRDWHVSKGNTFACWHAALNNWLAKAKQINDTSFRPIPGQRRIPALDDFSSKNYGPGGKL